MTDEYTARERALTLAHSDCCRDITVPAEDVIELAEKYLAFLMPRTRGFLPQLHNGGIAG